jgi:hypothetical protein
MTISHILEEAYSTSLEELARFCLVKWIAQTCHITQIKFPG